MAMPIATTIATTLGRLMSEPGFAPGACAGVAIMSLVALLLLRREWGKVDRLNDEVVWAAHRIARLNGERDQTLAEIKAARDALSERERAEREWQQFLAQFDAAPGGESYCPDCWGTYYPVPDAPARFCDEHQTEHQATRQRELRTFERLRNEVSEILRRAGDF